MTTFEGNFATSGKSLSWTPLTAADFVSVNVYKDPNSILQAGRDITIHASNGNITFPLFTNATARDGIGEGASWRLNICTAAKGWRGDGTQGIAVKMTPVDNPGTAFKPVVGIAACDQAGDPTDATPAQAYGVGMEWASATHLQNVGTYKTGYDTSGTVAFAGNTPTVIGFLVPVGLIGDDTNPDGVLAARLVCGVCVLRQNDATVVYSRGLSPAAAAPRDAFYLILTAAMGAADATPENIPDFTVKFELCIFDLFPANEWA
jgi:hypothetical protein